MVVSASGVELHYSVRGDGPTCFVLTAIGTKPYERLMPAQLSERLRLVFVDLRGGGRSTADPRALTFDVLAEDLEAIRADLGVEHVAVLGHSILGVLAVEYARRCPSRVSHAILAGTPPRGDMTWLAAQSAAFFEQDAPDDRKRRLRENLAALPAQASPGQALLAQTPTRFFDAAFDAAPLFAESEASPALLAHLMGTLTRAWDITADIDTLRVPMFVAHGRHDYTVPHVLWRDVVPRIPGATWHLFDGHQPFFEEPDLFAAALTDWMNRVRVPA